MKTATKANVIEIGEIYTSDTPDEIDKEVGSVTEFGMLIKFKSAEDLRKAMKEGKCEFTLFGG